MFYGFDGNNEKTTRMRSHLYKKSIFGKSEFVVSRMTVDVRHFGGFSAYCSYLFEVRTSACMLPFTIRHLNTSIKGGIGLKEGLCNKHHRIFVPG